MLLALAIADLLVPEEEVQALKAFIKNSCLVFLEVDDKIDEELSKEHYFDYLRSFIADPEKNMIVVVQTKGDLKLIFNIEDMPSVGQALVFSKRKRAIYEPNVGLTKYSKVLNVLFLGNLESDFNPYDLTQNCI